MASKTPSTNIPNYYREQFIDKLNRLLQSLARVFPDCAKTTQRALEISVAMRLAPIREKIVQEWHETMSPYYECADKRDEVMFREMATQNKWFRELDIVSKWDDSGFEKSHDIMWRNVQALNHNARMHCVVPDAVMDRVCDMAVSMVKGTGSTNASDLLEQGMLMADSMSDADLAKFAREGPAMLGSITESLMKMQKGDNDGLGSDPFVQTLGERVLAGGGLSGIDDIDDEEVQERLAGLQKLSGDALKMKDSLLLGCGSGN